jgi:hypothetical protein
MILLQHFLIYLSENLTLYVHTFFSLSQGKSKKQTSVVNKVQNN